MILNDLQKLTDYYYYLESSLIDLIQTIPLENNGKTYSPKLYDILQSTCSQFESLLTLLCNHLKLQSTSRGTIKNYYEQINKYGLLYWQMVTYRAYPYGEPTCPFRDADLELSFVNKSKLHSYDTSLRVVDSVPTNHCRNKLPVWWKKYNETKHELPSGYMEGNLQNTCTALAGLYSLHALCYHLKDESSDVKLDPKKWYYTYPYLTGIHHDQLAEHHIPTFKSNFFIYLVRP